MSQSRPLISLVIAAVIGLHAVPVLWRSERGTLWPFMQWAMYKNSRPPGPIEAKKRRIIAVTSSGGQAEVTPHVLGLSITVLEQRYFRPLGTGDSAAARDLLQRLNRTAEEPFVAIRYESETFTATDAGVISTDGDTLVYQANSPESR